MAKPIDLDCTLFVTDCYAIFVLNTHAYSCLQAIYMNTYRKML